jgi:hypothetical protein
MMGIDGYDLTEELLLQSPFERAADESVAWLKNICATMHNAMLVKGFSFDQVWKVVKNEFADSSMHLVVGVIIKELHNSKVSIIRITAMDCICRLHYVRRGTRIERTAPSIRNAIEMIDRVPNVIIIGVARAVYGEERFDMILCNLGSDVLHTLLQADKIQLGQYVV